MNISVTIQPQGTTGTTSQTANQSAAQFASNLATGTLRRAIGTITSFVTGKEPPSVVVYTTNGNEDEGNAVHVVPEPTVSTEDITWY